jgi:CHASE1-domain containing sensor protein
MNVSVRQTLRKHNGFIAQLLSLVIMISGSLQLVHDQLLDHEHTVDCPMFVLDSSAAVPEATSLCIVAKQIVEEQPYHPIALVLSQFKTQQARAPPALV